MFDEHESRPWLRRRDFLRGAGIGAAGLAGAALIGCGGDDDGGAAPAGGTATATATATPAAAQPKRGGELIVSAIGDVTALDPHTATADTMNLRVTSLFQALTKQDNHLSYVPELAESWEAAPDALEWVFKLRPGVKFHDGSELTADVVKANFDRVRNPDNGLGARSALIFLDQVQVVDSRTVKFIHSQPDAAALANVGSLIMISQQAFDSMSAEDLARNPVGTGPFKFQKWEPDVEIVMDRFPDYWGGPALLDSVNFKVIRDESTRVTALRAGDVDFISNVSFSLLPVVENDANVQVLETIPFFRTYFGVGNRPKFDDQRVRQAVVRYGCPRDAIVEKAYMGRGEPAVGPVPSVSEWYVDYTDLVYFDPQKAKALLDAAGVSNLEFDVIYPAGEASAVDALTVWQDALAGIGVKMNLAALDRGAYIGQIIAPEGDYDLCFAPSEGPIGDFQVVRVTHRSDGWANISHNTDNPEIDALIDKAQTTLQFEERKALYDQAFRLIIDDSEQYYVTFYPNYRMLSKRVRGYDDSNSSFFRFPEVWLAT